MIVLDGYEPAPPSPRTSERIVVALEGELDIASAPVLSVVGQTVRDHPGAHVLVDLTDVTFLDAAALRAFVRAREGARAGGGDLSLHGARPFARGLLELWRLGPVGPAVRADDSVPRLAVPHPRSDADRRSS
ncbi:hypothetical protein GCM10023339_71750 [Alloalcanivorax gelatiniphagus]